MDILYIYAAIIVMRKTAYDLCVKFCRVSKQYEVVTSVKSFLHKLLRYSHFVCFKISYIYDIVYEPTFSTCNVNPLPN